MTAKRRVPMTLLALFAGCPDRTISELVPEQTKVERKDIPVNINRDIDILFVIDKSPTMEDEQNALSANFPRFIQSLSQIEGGLPNVHIGVISQDIGAGGFTVGGNCSGAGDDGKLLTTPRIPGCTPPDGNFISDIDNGDGLRQTNYTGSLEDTFSCIATLGPNGCGFEQHLGSLDKALKNPANAGFLRDDAFLSIIFISDEDDCSASDPALYDPNNSSVGPLADFRCFEWGWECDEGTMARAPGTYTNCRPRTDSPFLHHPDHFVDSIKRIKRDPKQIIVSTIIGPSASTDPQADDTNQPGYQPTDTTSVTTNAMSVQQVSPSCKVGTQNAFPMPRLHHFAQQFPERNSFFSLCNDDNNDGQADLQRGLDLIAQLIKRTLGQPCFESNVSTTDQDPNNPGLQLECSVAQVSGPGSANPVETIVPACKMADEVTPAADTAQPCWYAKTSPACTEFPTQLAFAVYPEQRTTPPDAHMIVQCVVAN